ncbi:GAF domain-containing protein [Sorangium sp. So ce302]|uniref:GAF domain-containing protein n=1 Tax=Sorangium sp. So ce302 TaxID=3133297 RepID=UPI003F624642
MPLAAHGLAPEAPGRTFCTKAHPRLDILCHAEAPVRFAPDTELPDPFDGLLASDATAPAHVHACLGCPLRVEGTLIGLLTADARDPRAFEGVDAATLSWLGALAGAAVRTSQRIDALEHSAERLGLVADDLRRAAERERGASLLGTSPAMVLQASRGVPRGAPVVVKPAHLGVDVAAAPEPAPREDDAEKAPAAAAAPLNEQVDAFQRGLIERAVAQQDGNWAAAARSLGMHRSNLHHLAKRLGLR